MKYPNFIAVAERTFKEFKAIKETGSDVVLHMNGETAETPELKKFIRNTNTKYFGKECDTLLGDFAEIVMNKDDVNTEFVRINMANAYGVFMENNHSWEAVEEFVADQIDYAMNIRNDALEVIKNLSDYNKIKSSLIIRPLNYDIHKYELEDYVYDQVGDIALVLYAVVRDNGEALNSIKIPKEIFDQWNIDGPEVFSEVIINTYSLAMPRLYTSIFGIETTPDSESAFMSEDCTLKSLAPNTIPLLTTTRKVNGAIAMFYHGVAEKIAEMFGDSFYVAFTSMHECMLHKIGTMDPDSIRRHVRATNKTFGPEDTLTNEVYLYNKETKKFAVV